MKVLVEISSDPVYCNDCKATCKTITGCWLAIMYADSSVLPDHKYLERDELGRLKKCRWCLETYPC
jgi:hypothetical protein